MLEPLTVGTAYDWTTDDGTGNGARKDGAVWNLTGATVSFAFRRPQGGGRFERAASAVNAAAGVFHYAGDGTELDRPGTWAVCLKVINGGLPEFTTPVEFRVILAP